MKRKNPTILLLGPILMLLIAIGFSACHNEDDLQSHVYEGKVLRVFQKEVAQYDVDQFTEFGYVNIEVTKTTNCSTEAPTECTNILVDLADFDGIIPEVNQLLSFHIVSVEKADDFQFMELSSSYAWKGKIKIIKLY